MSRNEHTGDSLQTKPASDAYRSGYDRIFSKPAEPVQLELDLGGEADTTHHCGQDAEEYPVYGAFAKVSKPMPGEFGSPWMGVFHASDALTQEHPGAWYLRQVQFDEEGYIVASAMITPEEIGRLYKELTA